LIASHTIGHSFATNRYKKTPTAVPIGIKEHSKSRYFTLHKKARRQGRQRGLIYEDLNKDKT
jgi:hypothetical protein